MIVTLTGAYRNAGDHLIGNRAHHLLQTYVDQDIVTLDRNRFRLNPGTLQAQDNAEQRALYSTINKANAVILCGGPAYQVNIFPRIYPLDLDKVETKVIPMGLGWKGSLHENPRSFQFSEAAEGFVRRVHQGIACSSVRDNLTTDVLTQLGVANVEMTGCPAWYNLDSMDKPFEKTHGANIVVSDAALNAMDCIAVLRHIADRFPQATLTFALHHGYYPQVSKKGARFAAQHVVAAAYARSRGYRICNLSSDLQAMRELYDQCDLHIGYRVHAHIYCLSGRTASLLIAEDSRGVAQSEALNCPVLMGDDGALIEQLDQAIDGVLRNSAGYFSNTMAAMQTGFQTMQRFLNTI